MKDLALCLLALRECRFNVAAGFVFLGGFMLLLAGCSSHPPSTVHICDNQGCSDRDRNVSRYVVPEDPPFPADGDNWKGEALAELQAAASGGDDVAAYKLGIVYQGGLGGAQQDSKLAEAYFAQAANAGHAWAQYRLAQMYFDGAGVPKNLGRAVSLIFSAAQKGLPQASYNLGLLYANGTGVGQDDPTAARWFMRAAQEAVPEAQYNLALMYFRGTGVRRQLYDALQWMRKAGSSGSLPAQIALGQIYYTGLETMHPDWAEAKSWLTTAADRGDAESKKLLDRIYQQEYTRDQQNLAFQRQLQLLQAETAAYWSRAVYAAWLYPPVVRVVVY